MVELGQPKVELRLNLGEPNSRFLSPKRQKAEVDGCEVGVRGLRRRTAASVSIALVHVG